MSRRELHSQSQGSIPFSWEDSPGVSKVVMHHHCNVHDHETPAPPPPPPPCSIKNKFSSIPLPPCPSLMQQAPRRSRSSSAKGFGRLLWQLEDPFLAAYKECTKSRNVFSKSSAADHQTSKKSSKLIKSKFVFSCKTTSSCDVRGDNLLFVNLLRLKGGK